MNVRVASKSEFSAIFTFPILEIEIQNSFDHHSLSFEDADFPSRRTLRISERARNRSAVDMFSNLQNYGSCIKIRVSNFISIPRDPAKLCMLVCRCCGSSSELREISMTHFKFVCTRIEIKRGLLFNIVLSFTRSSHPLGPAAPFTEYTAGTNSESSRNLKMPC